MENIENITKLTTADLPALLEQIWAILEQGAADSHNAYHTPALGTMGAGRLGLRTVVLRTVNPAQRQLVCHTDIRSGKVAEVRANPAVVWLFYAAQDKIQIRADGLATVHHEDETARQAWQQSRLMSRRVYATAFAPGTPVPTPTSGLPEDLSDRSPTEEESEAGWPNFAVISSLIHHFDWLYLDSKGNQRAEFKWTEEIGGFVGSWIAP